MTTVPDYEDSLDDIKAALVAICQVITPQLSGNTYAYTRVQQAPPFWSQFWSRAVPLDEGTGYQAFSETVVLTYHVAKITDAGNAAESEAQRAKVAAQVEFSRRPFLQSEGTYARGVNAVAPDGVALQSVAIVRAGETDNQSLAVQVTLTIPVLFQSDTLDF